MAASGLALIFGNEGKDFIITGPDGKEAFGGTGNDFILGGDGGDFLLGNEGDDWIEGGERLRHTGRRELGAVLQLAPSSATTC